MSVQTEPDVDTPSLSFDLEGIETAVGLTRAELAPHLRLMAALKMFELGKVSSGTAARLAGLSRVDFFETCSRYGVSPFNLPTGELETELRAELRLAEP